MRLRRGARMDVVSSGDQKAARGLASCSGKSDDTTRSQMGRKMRLARVTKPRTAGFLMSPEDTWHRAAEEDAPPIGAGRARGAEAAEGSPDELPSQSWSATT
jgi:hypothetical protein